MAFGFILGMALLLPVWLSVKSVHIPEGVVRMECRDRYFMIAADLSCTGERTCFEAVDGTGVHPITKQYAAQCGYSISVLPVPGLVELRASYFSCHTDSKDEAFTFNFNLIKNREGREVTYTVNHTCSPTLPWSPREVTCEVNYMEVSVRTEVICPPGTKMDNWTAVTPTQSSTTSDWQVVFQRAEEQHMPMNLSEARNQGYILDVRDKRFVFRTPYGQPDSFSTEVNGVKVEVVHATLFSRQSWVVLMVDLVAACSMYEGSYDGRYMMWETPEVLQPLMPGLYNRQIKVGINGELLEQPVAEERGYIVEKHDDTIQINIPYNAEQAYRKSLVTSDLYEFYVFNLNLEQVSVDNDDAETRIRFHRMLATPLLLRPVFTENQTVLDERLFAVYLGDVPEDVELTAVHLNGQEFAVPFANTSMHTIAKVVQANRTHGYTLKVPFDDPVVIRLFSKEDAVLQFRLDINFTLTVLPENEPFYHQTSLVALFTDVSPPQFDTTCSESGISFKLDHRPFDYLWHIGIGSDLLTPELAAQHGYTMTNTSQSLLLDMPLFTHGYEYKNFTLKGFLGTFEILVRDHDTSEVQSSTAKTCPFALNELIVCSTDGRLTVMADLSPITPRGGIPGGANLIDKYCRPKEADDTRALFSFPLNGCGSIIKLGKENVTYQNEIFYSKTYLSVGNMASEDAIEKVIVQCTYPLAGLHRLFSLHRFESDAPGTGSITHIKRPMTDTAGPQISTVKPTTTLQTTPAATHPRVRYVKVSRFHHFNDMKKGAGGTTQTRASAAHI